MVIDCHYHLEERVMNIQELLAEMDRAGIDKIALMGSKIAPFPEPPRFLLRLLHERRFAGDEWSATSMRWP